MMPKSFNYQWFILVWLAASMVFLGCEGRDRSSIDGSLSDASYNSNSMGGTLGNFGSGIGDDTNTIGTIGTGDTGSPARGGFPRGFDAGTQNGDGSTSNSSGSCVPEECPGWRACCTEEGECGNLNRDGECVVQDEGTDRWQRNRDGSIFDRDDDAGSPWQR